VSVDDAELVSSATESRHRNTSGTTRYEPRGPNSRDVNSDPDWDPQLFAGKRRLYYGRWVYKYESADPPGAGVRSSSTTTLRPLSWQYPESWGGEQL